MKNKVKLMRLVKGLSQIELARKSRLSKGTLSLIERGLVDPKPESRTALAVALECDQEWLFTDAEIITKDH